MSRGGRAVLLVRASCSLRRGPGPRAARIQECFFIYYFLNNSLMLAHVMRIQINQQSDPRIVVQSVFNPNANHFSSSFIYLFLLGQNSWWTPILGRTPLNRLPVEQKCTKTMELLLHQFIYRRPVSPSQRTVPGHAVCRPPYSACASLGGVRWRIQLHVSLQHYISTTLQHYNTTSHISCFHMDVQPSILCLFFGRAVAYM